MNFEEFEKFCSISKIGKIKLKNIFDYLDYERDQEVTYEEFDYRINQTNYDEGE